MSDVEAVAKEGEKETSSDMMPWNLEENPAYAVVSAVLRRYLLAFYTKRVNSDHNDCDVWSAQSQSAMSNIPDF